MNYYIKINTKKDSDQRESVKKIDSTKIKLTQINNKNKYSSSINGTYSSSNGGLYQPINDMMYVLSNDGEYYNGNEYNPNYYSSYFKHNDYTHNEIGKTTSAPCIGENTPCKNKGVPYIEKTTTPLHNSENDSNSHPPHSFTLNEIYDTLTKAKDKLTDVDRLLYDLQMDDIVELYNYISNGKINNFADFWNCNINDMKEYDEQISKLKSNEFATAMMRYTDNHFCDVVEDICKLSSDLQKCIDVAGSFKKIFNQIKFEMNSVNNNNNDDDKDDKAEINSKIDE